MPGPLPTGDAHVITRHLSMKGGIYVLALAAALTLDLSYPNELLLDPGGADRTVTLPEADGNTADGAAFFVRNTGSQGEELTIQDSTPTTVVVLGAGEAARVRSSGSAWLVVEFHPAVEPAQLRLGVQSRTLTGDLVLVAFDQKHQVIDPSGASRAVTLPAAADAAGKVFEILNNAEDEEALNITITGLGIVARLPRGGSLVVGSDGTSWALLRRDWDGTRNVVDSATLAGTKTLVSSDKLVQRLDPGGAGRDVVLPAEAVCQGHDFIVVNAADGDEDLTVKDDGGTTIAVVGQNQQCTFRCNGTAWTGDALVTIVAALT